MEYRRLGRTELNISEISFGCGTSAKLMIEGTPVERQRMIGQALDLGINLFDTAPAYGDGISETHLGQDLRALKAKPYIASKISLHEDKLEDVYQAVIDSIDNSLKRLQTDRIDLIQLHNRVSNNGIIRKTTKIGPFLTLNEVEGERGVLDALDTLRQQGKVGFYGFTTYGGDPEAIDFLLNCGRFHAINAIYNLLNPSAGMSITDPSYVPNYGNVIGKAMDNQMGVMVIRVLAGGLLTGTTWSDQSVQMSAGYEKSGEWFERLVSLLETDKCSLAQLAIRYGLSHPGVSSVVGGFTLPDHLVEAIDSSKLGSLQEDSMTYINEIHRSVFNNENNG